MPAQVPEAPVLLLELGLVRGREVGFDLAEDVGVCFSFLFFCQLDFGMRLGVSGSGEGEEDILGGGFLEGVVPPAPR